MGRDKALLPVDGEPMAVGVVRALTMAGAREVVCVGGDVDALRALGLESIDDDYPDAGPLGGIITGIAWASEPVALVTPCDLLRPDARSFRELITALLGSESLVAVPIVDGKWRPLPAALRSAARAPLSEAFDEGERAVHRAMERVGFVAAEVGVFTDVDTPEDLPGRR